MDFEEAIKVLDAHVFAQKSFHLKDVELVILRGALQGKKYQEIAKASGYTSAYLQQDIGPKLWKLLSEVLDEKVSKTNFQAALERLWRFSLEARQTESQKQNLARIIDFKTRIDDQNLQNSASDRDFDQELTSYKNLNLVGRERAIADLNSLINKGAKIILIQGEGGVGKSLLSWEFLSNQGFDLILELWMAKETKNITDAKSVVEEWLRRHFDEQPAVDFSVTLERLRQKLRDETKRIAVLIDNLEPALDKYGKFIKEHSDYVELLRILANPAGNCVTLITSRERLGESAVPFQDYRLPGLELKAWQEFFNSRNIRTDLDALQAMHAAYNGNAKAMQIISGAIQTDWEGDIDAYWQANKQNLLIERDLEDLIVSQFNRLQQLDSEAYKLLCRMGCYRYQEVRSVWEDGVLYMLWDVEDIQQRRRIIKSLRDRSLLDFYKGEYYLHTIIRSEAIARLKAMGEWETVNGKAAEFWTQSVKTVETVEDALKAFEAYYHYKGINDFDRACEVLIKERPPNSRNEGEPEMLTSSFNRLGLVQHTISAITSIIDKISDGYYLTILYGDLGGSYHRIGDIQNTLKYYNMTREKAINCQKLLPESNNNSKIIFELKKREIGVLYGISACKVALGETVEAIKSYEETVTKTLKTEFNIFAILSWFSLSYLYSDRESSEYNKQKASEMLETASKAYKELPQSLQTTWWVYTYINLWSGLTYKNLGENEKALEKFRRCLSYTEQNNMKQNKAQALGGLALVYCNIKEFDKAIGHHAEAIEILDKLAGKSDLAEAYWQMGLTYQKMGDVENSKKKFEAAIGLYYQIGAPKQITKVQMAMEARGTKEIEGRA